MFTSNKKQKMKDYNISDKVCIADFHLYSKNRNLYPEANALEFWPLVQIIARCLLQWNQDNNKSKGRGFFGQIDAYGSAFEEQEKENLYMHMMIWVKPLQMLLEEMFCDDGTINEAIQKSLLNYINIVMSSSYELFESSDEIIKHHMFQGKEKRKFLEKLNKLIIKQ